MPNHCSSTLTIGPLTETQAQRIINACETNQLATEFYPEPDWASTPNEHGWLPGPRYSSDVPKRLWWKCSKLLYSSGPIFPDGSHDQRWYNWRNTAWGTKWGAYECDATYDPDRQAVTVCYQTAWSPLGLEWFEHLSDAYPNAEITCMFEEPGCEFYGMTYARNGSAHVRYGDLNELRSTWLTENYSPEQVLAIENNEDDELSEEVLEVWYDVYLDKCYESAQVMLAEMKEQWTDLSHELKGSQLIDVLKSIDDNILIEDWTTLNKIKAMIFAGYITQKFSNAEHGHLVDSLDKEATLRAAMQRFDDAVSGTHEYIEQKVKQAFKSIN